MNKLILISIVLTVSAFLSIGQEIPYATGQWNPEGLGNHRAVIYVKKIADAVKIKIPWRRLDKVDDKALILIDALTNRRIKNIYATQLNQDFGEIVFEPVSGEGNYYLYYMPSRNTGNWWFPNAEYEKPTDTFDLTWKNNTVGNTETAVAQVIRFESVSGYHSFYPMEIPITQSELSELQRNNQEKDFLLFTEVRNFPCRMIESIPYRWYKKGIKYEFEGTAQKDEVYTWQIGVFAAFKELNSLKLTFSDLKTKTGAIISAQSLRAINMGGSDHLGKKFVKNIIVPKGEVRSMWIITDINKDQQPGTYKGKVTVSAAGTKEYTIDVTIHVTDKVAENRGYDIPQNMSRLNWLDSKIGIDDEVFAPFIPATLKDKTVSILGRKLTFNRYGFPVKITSSFTQSNTATDGPNKNVIAGDIRLDVLENGKVLNWSSKALEITLQTTGAVAWKNVLHSANVEVRLQAKMECDGYINYETRITAKNDVNLDDVKLVIPYEKTTATYLMGLGVKGGYTPEKIEWKWQQERANNMIWIGTVNAGMQIKLKNITPDWKLYSFEKTSVYKDWSNEGKGGCDVIKTGKNVLLTAYTGSKIMRKGDEMVLNFGLAITPFKTLDNKHWNERYYHSGEKVNLAAVGGASVLNIHQGNVLNPYINYPFLTVDTLKNIIDKGKELGIRTKLYYTVRELSTYACELWAMRHLDDEIYTRSNIIMLADTPKDKYDKSIYGMTGHTWLYEHMRKDYDPAWHTILPNGLGWDMSIRTQGLSRLHNHYLEGLNWLTKKIGIRGLYLDGVGYDREIMKRVRKTMDRAADSCLIDFHSGNNYEPAYGLNSPANQYLELFPCINSLWLGEGYDYKTSAPDYWLVEISGIPFGIYSEMLQDCGNAYRGMVYGMSSRLGWMGCNPSAIWKLWDSFGISGSEYIGYWDDKNSVKTNNKDILASAYLKNDKVMIAMGSWAKSDQLVSLNIDWKKIGINPASAKIEIPNIDGLQKTEVADLKKLVVPASQGLIIIIHQ